MSEHIHDQEGRREFLKTILAGGAAIGVVSALAAEAVSGDASTAKSECGLKCIDCDGGHCDKKKSHKGTHHCTKGHKWGF